MAALNQAKIIKGLEEITAQGADRFFFKFLKLYGFSKLTIQKLEQNDRVRNIGLRDGDYGLAKQIYFCESIPGGGMDERLEELIQNPVLLSHKVRFFLVTDYQRLIAYDRRVDDRIDIDFADLKNSYDFFLPLTGQYEKPLAYSTHPADARACERMGRLYDSIRELNHYEADDLHNLNVFLTRLLFCFYAEDTGIFSGKGQMTAALESMTAKDGSDLPDFFEKLFTALDLPEDDPRRKDLPATICAFPYVNGGLFSEKAPVPHFNARARRVLIESGRLSWSEISPVIFGSMFQSVMDPELRHELGAHYTSEKNIFKVIGPLFLDDLRAELDTILEIKTKSLRLRKLRDYQEKLASLKVADPACGCGNFLVVAFRELKLLELKAVEEILNCEDQKDRSLFSDWTHEYSRVSIDQFYGIEIEEFPADIARALVRTIVFRKSFTKEKAENGIFRGTQKQHCL